MIRRLFAVAAVTSMMAVVGTYLVALQAHVDASFPYNLPYSLYVHVLVVSNVLWLFVARYIARRSAALWQAIAIGLVSPLVGALGVPFGVPVVLRLYYICFPIGLATGYIVWRIMTSPWRHWRAAA